MAEVVDNRPIIDVGDLLKLDTKKFKVAHPWWRGHGQNSWPLVASVHRITDRGTAYEAAIALRFQQRAPSRRLNCPGADDEAAWLFLMQHHRLPTRLLDWTESPLVALYFAVTEEAHDDTPGALWALDPFALNGRTMEDPVVVRSVHSRARPLILEAFNIDAPKNDDTVIALVTDEIDLRMLMQSSAMTIHGSGTPLETYEGSETFLTKFEVSAKAKSLIRKQLDYLGIRISSLFPDLDHLAVELRQMTYS